jgi:hypothetical protein
VIVGGLVLNVGSTKVGGGWVPVIVAGLVFVVDAVEVARGSFSLTAGGRVVVVGSVKVVVGGRAVAVAPVLDSLREAVVVVALLLLPVVGACGRSLLAVGMVVLSGGSTGGNAISSRGASSGHRHHTIDLVTCPKEIGNPP